MGATSWPPGPFVATPRGPVATMDTRVYTQREGPWDKEERRCYKRLQRPGGCPTAGERGRRAGQWRLSFIGSLYLATAAVHAEQRQMESEAEGEGINDS